jgi:hypothetical protein
LSTTIKKTLVTLSFFSYVQIKVGIRLFVRGQREEGRREGAAH